MDSIRRSFKTQPSYKHSRKTSGGGGGGGGGGSGGDEDVHQEAQPILSDHNYIDSAKSTDSEDRGEVIVKIDGNEDMGSDQCIESSGIWRDTSYEFWKDEDLISGGNNDASGSNNNNNNSKDGFHFQQQQEGGGGGGGGGTIDPPSILIKQFLNKQNASGDKALDMDLEMDELQHDRTLPPIAESPTVRQVSSKDLRVSFQEFTPDRSEINPEPVVRYSQSSDFEDQSYNIGGSSSNNGGVGVSGRGIAGGGGGGGGRAQVLKCTSNVGFQKNYSLLRSKTKSRLLDPPLDEPQYMRSGLLAKSGQMKSGFLSSKGDDDDEDPFAEEDIPGEFRKTKLNAITILQWVSLVLIIAAFICSLLLPSFVEMRLWELHLWKWELLVLVLICGRLLSGWGIRIVVFFIERNFLLRKRVLYFVYGVRKAVQNCLWLGLVLIAWGFMFDKKVERKVKNKVLPYVTKVLVCLLVGTLIWLVKTLLVKVLASSFHVSTYFDRIQDSLFNQYVIETLSGPPLLEFQKMYEEDEKVMAEIQILQNAGATLPADLRATAFPDTRSVRGTGSGSVRGVGSSGRVIGSGMLQKNSKAGKSVRLSGVINRQQGDGITIDHLHKMNQKNISAWNMKRLMNIVRHGVLSTLDERISDSQDDDSAMQIRNEFEAKRAAKAIFNNVAKRGSKYIYLQDLMRFMREDEALKTMNLFEGAKESKRVNKSALKNWVVNAFRERRALALTLNDTKTAVKKLHHIVNMVVSVLIFVIWLLILEIATTHILVLISSQLVLVVFIFGNTCKTTFEAIIFLFVMHPFDVGDRCEIDKVQMIVEEMNILTTVFLRYDNQKIIYPNSILATLPISNYYRSPDMGDTIEFCIHISTSAEKIALMKQRIASYVDSKPDIWYPSPMVVVKDVEDMNRVKIAVWLTHRMNHQDMAERWNRRAYLVEEMIKIFRELDIEYRMLPVDMNVRNMPPCSSLRFPTNWTTCTN